MKFIVDVDFPHEPFNTFVREGVAGETLGATGSRSPRRNSNRPA